MQLANLECGNSGGDNNDGIQRFRARAYDGEDAAYDAIMRGDDLDVIEIDGASNRGVEQARNRGGKGYVPGARDALRD